MSKRQDNEQLTFDPTCPSGGSWYACGKTFLGCCASNACTPNGCSEGNLRTVAFDKNQYGKFPDATCGSGSKFYTCGFGPTFWGCCKSNPCDAGAVCPDGDLAGAYVGNPAQSAYYMAEESASTSTTPTSSSTIATSTYTSGTLVTSISSTTSISTDSTLVPAASSSATAVASSSNNDKHTAAIAGGSAGGGVIIALLLCWLIYYVCYVKRSRKKHNDELERRQSDLAIATMTEKPNKPTTTHGFDSAPPLYSSPNPNTYPYNPYEPNTYANHYDAPSPAGVWKPHHRPRASELSGETVWRGELESPMHSPHVNSASQSSRVNSGEEPTWSGSYHYTGTGNTQGKGTQGNGDAILRTGHQSVAEQAINL